MTLVLRLSSSVRHIGAKMYHTTTPLTALKEVALAYDLIYATADPLLLL